MEIEENIKKRIFEEELIFTYSIENKTDIFSSDELNLNIKGCIWGAICGEVIGYRYKYTDSKNKLEKDLEKFQDIYGVKYLDILGGGMYQLNAGQLGSLSEIMICLLYSIIINGCIYNPVISSRYYSIWYDSNPKNNESVIENSFKHHEYATTEFYKFCDHTTNYEKILSNSNKLNFDNKTGSFLIRCIPIAIYYYNIHTSVSFTIFIDCILYECNITHPHDDCKNMALMYGYSIFLALKGTDKKEIFNTIISMIFVNDTHKKILSNSLFSPKYDINNIWKELHYGCSIQNAFYYFMRGDSIENAFKETIGLGGNVDLNCSVLGGLYGAYYGHLSLPERWIKTIDNSCNKESTYLRYETLNYIKPDRIDKYLFKLQKN